MSIEKKLTFRFIFCWIIFILLCEKCSFALSSSHKDVLKVFFEVIGGNFGDL